MVLPPGHHREIASRRPLSTLEKRTLGTVGAALVAFAVVLAISLIGSGHVTTRGCVDATILGATGAATVHECGADARALCRVAGTSTGAVTATQRQIQAACRRDGLAVN